MDRAGFHPPSKMHGWALAAALLLLAPASSASGADVPGTGNAEATRASATVAIDDPVYGDLDRLDALGYLPEELLGQAPLSRGEIARIVEAASQRADAVVEPARSILIRLKDEFPVLPRGEDQGIDRVSLGAAWSNSGPETIRNENGLGQIDGVVQPVAAYRLGSPIADGGTGWLETDHAHALGSHVALGIRTHLSLLWGYGAEDQMHGIIHAGGAPHPAAAELALSTEPERDLVGDLVFQSLYARTKWGPVIVQVGRDGLQWGPAPMTGFLLSGNARPLDMVMLTHDAPYRLPWIFRYMGRHRLQLFVGRLGADRVLPNAKLFGGKASFRPHRLIELGFSETLVFGGDGAPKPGFFRFLNEIIPIGLKGTNTDYSDHRFGFDARLHLLPGKLLLYNELMVEDARDADYYNVTSWRAGAFLPAVGPGGLFDARGELVRVPAVAYRHGRWTTGYTLDERLIGDELGPDARGGKVEFRWHGRTGNQAGLSFHVEGRDADEWSQEPLPDGVSFGKIFRVTDNPTEWRYRSRVWTDWRLSPSIICKPRFAVERVRNAGFVDGAHHTDFLGEISFDFVVGRAPGVTTRHQVLPRVSP